MAESNIELALGEVVYANPVLRYCTIVFVGRAGSVNASYAGLSATSIQEVQVDPGISVGDRVVVIIPGGDGAEDGSDLTGGVVLCKVAANMLSFPELLNADDNAEKTLNELNTLLKHSTLHKLYDTLRYYSTGKDLEFFFPPSANPDELIAGDYSISQGNCRLKISDGAVVLNSKHAKAAITDNGTLLTDCLFRKGRDVTGWYNTAVLGAGRQAEELHRITDTGTDSVDGILAQYGLLANGETHTLIRDGVPMAQWGTDLSGALFQNSSRGFRSVMGSSMEVRSISGGSGLRAIDIKTEDALTQGSDESVASLVDADKYLKDSTNKFDLFLSADELEPAKDPTASDNTESKIISSLIDQTPDGGFVIRDGWGSEIRMFGGDIFISPARHLVVTAPGDVVTAAGGVTSCTGSTGVNIGSSKGPVEMSGKTEMSLLADKVNIVGINGSVGLGEPGIELSSCAKITAGATKNIEVISGDSICVLGESVTSIGRSANIVATSSSALKQAGGQLELAGNRVNVLSDIVLSSAKGKEFSVGGYSSKPSNGTGSLWCTGSVTVDKGITTNSWMKADGLVSCISVAVSSANKEVVGVFQGKKPGHTDILKPTDIKLTAPAINNIDPRKISIKDKLANVFKLISSGVYAILPRRKSKTVITPPTIDRKTDKGYIYPGEAFWNKAGKYTVSDELYTCKSYTVKYEKSGMSN